MVRYVNAFNIIWKTKFKIYFRKNCFKVMTTYYFFGRNILTKCFNRLCCIHKQQTATSNLFTWTIRRFNYSTSRFILYQNLILFQNRKRFSCYPPWIHSLHLKLEQSWSQFIQNIYSRRWLIIQDRKTLTSLSKFGEQDISQHNLSRDTTLVLLRGKLNRDCCVAFISSLWPTLQSAENP